MKPETSVGGTQGQTAPLRVLAKSLVRRKWAGKCLFFPNIFAVAARVEGLTLPEFLSNPTKIANSLKQIQGFLRCDGLVTYQDPCLEAEALGCKLDRSTFPAKIESVPFGSVQQLSQLIPATLEDMGRIPVAYEVTRRLRVMLREDVALLAGVSGPFTLLGQVLPPEFIREIGEEQVAEALPITAEVTRRVAKGFCEAGIDVLVITEDFLPRPITMTFDRWQSCLKTIANVIKFYEVLPILCSRAGLTADQVMALCRPDTGCAICVSPAQLEEVREHLLISPNPWGVAVPVSVFSRDRGPEEIERIKSSLGASPLHPSFLTTSDQIPHDTDMHWLGEALGHVRSLFLCSS